MECLGNTKEERAQYRRDYIKMKQEADRQGKPFDIEEFNTLWSAGLATPKEKYTKRPKIQEDAPEGKENETPKKGEGKPEKIQGEVLGKCDRFDVELITEAVGDVVTDFMESHGIQEPRKISQSLFSAMCIDIGEKVFKRSRILRRDDHSHPTAYDREKLQQVLGIYRRVAQECDKVATKHAFCDFCGISNWYLYNTRLSQLTPQDMQLVEKLFDMTDTAYKSSLLDKNMNTPLGVMASVNNDIYNVRQEERASVPMIEAGALRTLD